MRTRRTFLAAAGGAGVSIAAAAGAGIAGAPSARAGERAIPLLSTYVAGAGRYGLPRRLPAPGEILSLRREAGGVRDPRAVAVWTGGGVKLGYVPRIHVEALANLMDAAVVPVARVVSVSGPAARPDIALAVALQRAV